MNNDIKKDVPLSDLTCGFSHEGTCCPLAVSVLHDSTWLCSQHFRHLRRGQNLEAISFLYEVASNPSKFLNPDKKEHWFEEELRNFNICSKTWIDQMPKPLNHEKARQFAVKPAGELVEKKITELASDDLQEIKPKRKGGAEIAKNNESWGDLGW